MRAVARVCLAGVLAAAVAAPASAQESKSVALAKELVAALNAAKLDAIAAKSTSSPDVFVGALYFPGSELLVISAKYAAPPFLVEKIGKKLYRDVYVDLNSASVPESRVFVEDAGADGLKAKREENQPFDTYDAGGKHLMFDGDWKKQKLNEQDYMKVFAAADEQYTQMLTALLAEIKKGT